MGKRMLVLAVALALTLSLALARAEEREIDRGAYIQREEDGWAVYAPDGTRLIPAGTYAFIYRSDDHWIHIRDDDWHEGLLAPDGSVLLEPEWWLPLYVCGDRIIVHGDGRAVFMDLSGAPLGEVDDVSVGFICGDRAGLFREVNGRKRYGLVDRDGRVIVEPDWQYLEWNEASAEMGVAFVERDDLWGLVDPDGNVVLEPLLEELNWFRTGDGLVAAKAVDGGWGFIDAAGQWHIPARYDKVKAFRSGYAAVRKGAEWWIIDRDGAEICQLPPCDDAETLDGGYVRCDDYEVDAVCNEVAEARLYRIDGDRLRRLDHGGLTYVAPIREDGEGRAYFWVETGNGKSDLLDADGKRLNPAPFDNWPVFHEGLAVVPIEGKYAAVDMDGQVVASGYDDMTEFYNGHAIARIGDEYFLLDSAGGREPAVSPAPDGTTDPEVRHARAMFNLAEYYGCNAGEYMAF